MGKFSLGIQILIAVLLGIAVGLFFGPLTSVLNPIGSAYTMLLQMAVLPYITFSLIHGLGSITPDVGKKIFKSGWLYFFSLWTFIFVLIFALASLIPTTLSPLIMSEASSEIESEFTKNFLSNLIPENPFYDVINNIVPAVAIFGLITGIALMHVEKKEPLIGALERINQTIEKILHWLGLISPMGAFVYISIAFGTVHFNDLFKMQVYVFGFIASTLFIVLWLLPSLLASLTPLNYRESLRAFRYVCLVPFVTGLSTAAIPFINAFLRRLSQKHETHERFRETSQTILPIAYSFGHVGNAMILFFILFLSYYYRHPFTVVEQFLLSVLTIPLSLGSSTGNINSILFLIKQLGFPKGAADLFLEIKSFTNNFQVLLSIASVFTLLILTIYSYYGIIQIKWKAFIYHLATPVILFLGGILALQPFISPKDIYQNLYMDLTLTEAIENPVKATVYQTGDSVENIRKFPDPNIPEVFKQILETKVLKVGYFVDSIPFCYFNNQNQLVGFDVAYAYELARDLDCEIQFIPLLFDELENQLTHGIFDIGMSSIIMNEQRLLQMQFSFPYFEDNNILVVARSKKKPFLSLKTAQETKGLKIGAGGAQFDIAKQNFPNAEIIDIHSTEGFLKGEFDAIMWSQTTAIIWCLSHPDYVVIDYGDQIGKSYFAYPIRQHAIDFGFFLNNWLSLKEQSGFKKDMKNYWIHGIPPSARKPRWSILRNVLHWKN